MCEAFGVVTIHSIRRFAYDIAHAAQQAVGPHRMDTATPPRRGWTVWRLIKYVLVTLGALFTLLLAAICFGWWWMSGGVFRVDPFNPVAWSRPITDREDSTCYRGGMASDIEKRFLKPGMSRADVERLLGRPDHVPEPREYRYTLGMCSGFRIDYDDLHVYFNDRGEFERPAIIQH